MTEQTPDTALFSHQGMDSTQWAARWSRYVLIAGALLATAVPAWNLLVDPFDVFGTGLLSHSADPNERYLKTAHLLQVAGTDRAPDSLLIGASTAGAFRVASLNAAFDQARFYNFALRSGNFVEIEQILSFLQQRMPTTRVLMTVDLFQLVEPPKRGGFMSSHPDVAGTSRLEFWWSQLWASSALAGLGKIKVNLDGRDLVRVDLDTGEYHYATAALQTKMPDPKAHSGARRAIRADAVAALQRIAAWCEQQHIELILLPSPRLDGDDSVRRTLEALPDLRERVRWPPQGTVADFVDQVHFSADYADRWIDHALRSARQLGR